MGKETTLIAFLWDYIDYDTLCIFLNQLKNTFQDQFFLDPAKQKQALTNYINNTNTYNFTALFFSIHNYDILQTNLLLNYGAIITSKEFDRALKNNDTKMVKLLLNHVYKEDVVEGMEGYKPTDQQLLRIAKLFGNAPLNLKEPTRFDTILQQAYYQQALDFKKDGKISRMIKFTSKAARLASMEAFEELLELKVNKTKHEKLLHTELKKIRISYLLRSLYRVRKELEEKSSLIKAPNEMYLNIKKIKLVGKLISEVKDYFHKQDMAATFKECLSLVKTAREKGIILPSDNINREVVKFKELSIDQLFNNISNQNEQDATPSMSFSSSN